MTIICDDKQEVINDFATGHHIIMIITLKLIGNEVEMTRDVDGLGIQYPFDA
ncbi:hypothetical protein [Limosilactobacillus fastidiosus]|uniref:Uncharacterized protein n=1 Tax=Limosilactobacillus fastidiosus TaxID=2759855 RepID=A0A7W3YBP4_9LACO|nr:hypothetical protein [Limosilactobacillus fastidiosus]MBB1063415.1 hypothetical protein [Limosilactobacillus fastidiosus]MBB1085904.1 hypothetical protein [Limosilactobacillus fastidiosus]MCD7084683.1 hypothetical protein [Limosilactobacillus fastidiosus]MCD7085759.1 hypothetical protein [Limosilactobacillus fastidiosus]MCD7113836.1 hypothetical protein [Limosilactobacillus fastidiosus]